MGKTRLIAETGAGQHGVADLTTAAALMGMGCVVFMGVEDTGASGAQRVPYASARRGGHPVSTGTGTLKDACSAAFREWTSRIDDTHYCLGSCMGPHRSRPSCAISSRSSPRRSGEGCSKRRVGCRTS